MNLAFCFDNGYNIVYNEKVKIILSGVIKNAIGYYKKDV